MPKLKSFHFSLFTCYLLLVTSFAFSKTITGEATYQWSYSESYLDAQKRCKTEAIKNGVEAFATYIESETEVKNYMTTKDVIVAKSLALVRNVKITDEKTDWKNRKIWYRITGEIDEKETLKALKNKDGDIKTSGLYYFGEGEDSNKRKADKKAIEALVINIADDLQNRFADILPADENLHDFTESIINTYKTSFNKCKKKITGNKTLRYLKKEDLLTLFKPRVKKIQDFIEMAISAEQETRIGDALRYYYWALTLLRSHPEHNKLVSSHFANKLILLALPDKINQVFSNIGVNVTQVEKVDEVYNYYLKFTYKNKEVNNLDFAFFVGNDWSVLQNARNGKGVCDFIAKSVENLNRIRLNIEYRYENKAKIDQELKTVMDDVSQVYFPQSIIYADLNRKYHQPEKRKIPKIRLSGFDRAVKESLIKKTGIGLKTSEKQKCRQKVAKVVEAINSKKYDSVRNCFTKDGFKEFKSVIAYGRAKVLPEDFELKAGKINEQIVVRSIPMQFDFPGNNYKTMEKIVFTFNKDLKIQTISFALSDLAVKDILEKPDDFATMDEKLQILQFMEYYKSAYCLKEYDFIKNVFAENALIIVGKVLKPDTKPLGEMYKKLGNDQVEYIRMSKSEYLDHLQLVFKSNEFINIRFEDNELKKVGGKDRVYGIQIKQNYFSSNYADQGYLFLMMDLNNIKEPKIYVRSWQPKKNPDGTIIGIDNFEL